METTVNPTAEGGKQERASYGKFGKLEDLLNAYNSLEAEFTRRSQRLKELESVQKAEKGWEQKVQNLIAKYPAAQSLADELGEEVAKSGNIADEYCLEKALLSVLSGKYKPLEEQAKDERLIDEVLKNDSVRQKIIDDYRKKLDISLPKSFPKGGEIPVKAPVRPKSIYEAGELAIQMLKEI